MNNGRVTVWIGEREALPVRAIPYVTSWQESPNSIVRALTEPSTIKVGTNLAIPNRYLLVAYLMVEHEQYEPIPTSQWKDCAVALNSLTQKLKADERQDATDENYGLWRLAAIVKLPNNVFVWLDEFQSWYSATRPILHREGDSTRMSALQAARKHPDYEGQHGDDLEAELFQTADDSLCLTPILPPEIEGKLWRNAEVAVAAVAEKKKNNMQSTGDDLLKDDADGTASKHREKGAKWSGEELQELLREHRNGATPQMLASKHSLSRQRISTLLTQAREAFGTKAKTELSMAGQAVRTVKF